MKQILTLIFSLLAGGTFAQDAPLPALFDVSGVASDDTLNVRLDPNASAEIIGELSFDAAGVEVVAYSENGHWALVNSEGYAGWVSTNFLSAVNAPEWWEMTTPLSCYGTEPFWNAEIVPSGQSQLENMGEPALDLSLDWITPVWGNPDWDIPYSIAMDVSADGRSGISVIRAEFCDDGMSDQQFALRIEMFFQSGGSAFDSYSGCCSIGAG